MHPSNTGQIGKLAGLPRAKAKFAKSRLYVAMPLATPPFKIGDLVKGSDPTVQLFGVVVGVHYFDGSVIVSLPGGG